MGPALAKIHEAADEIDDVDGGTDLVEHRLREYAHHPTLIAATVAPVAALGRLTVTERLDQRMTRQSVAGTALRSAPLPLPWIRRTLARPAMKASSRYFSTQVPRLVRSSVPVAKLSAAAGARGPGSVRGSTAAPDLARPPRPVAAVGVGRGRTDREGTRTVTAPGLNRGRGCRRRSTSSAADAQVLGRDRGPGRERDRQLHGGLRRQRVHPSGDFTQAGGESRPERAARALARA